MCGFPHILGHNHWHPQLLPTVQGVGYHDCSCPSLHCLRAVLGQNYDPTMLGVSVGLSNSVISTACIPGSK